MDKAAQIARAKAFAALHVKSNPVKLFNVWDAASAATVARAGAAALATSSFAVALVHGAADGEKLPRNILMDAVAEMAGKTDLPITVDVEAGYGRAPEAVADTVRAVIAAGGIGINLEDGLIGAEGLFPVEEQAARIAAARAAADVAGIPLFINARCDVFKKIPPDQQAPHVAEALTRAKAYAAAGASGFFVPWQTTPTLITDICEATSLPVNILASPATPSAAELAKCGVSRISLGAWPVFDMLARLEATAKDYFATGIARSD